MATQKHLDRLQEQYITYYMSEDDKIFGFYESLDYYGKVVCFSKQELAELIEELKSIQAKMKE